MEEYCNVSRPNGYWKLFNEPLGRKATKQSVKGNKKHKIELINGGTVAGDEASQRKVSHLFARYECTRENSQSMNK